MRFPLVGLGFLLLVACGDDADPNFGGGGAGSGGDAASGGQPGVGGGGPVEVRECVEDEDCVLRDDCCSCASVPIGDGSSCDLTCEQSSCSAMGIDAPGAVCRAGQCVFATSCNGATVACDAAPPECGPGRAASVEGDCWGPCIAVHECSEVTACAACGALPCLDEVAFTTTHHCIGTGPEACPGPASCECLGELCGDDPCSIGAEGQVTCTCIDC